jgi:hypothetical protein
MSLRGARIATVIFFVVFALAVTWPGVVPFNRVHPLVLGLPFNMAWTAFWIVAGGLVLWALDRVEARHRAGDD